MTSWNMDGSILGGEWGRTTCPITRWSMDRSILSGGASKGAMHYIIGDLLV